MNVVGRCACLWRVILAGCGGSSQDDLEAVYGTEFAGVNCDRSMYQCRARTADGRRTAVVLALDDYADDAIVTTGDE